MRLILKKTANLPLKLFLVCPGFFIQQLVCFLVHFLILSWGHSDLDLSVLLFNSRGVYIILTCADLRKKTQHELKLVHQIRFASIKNAVILPQKFKEIIAIAMTLACLMTAF